MLHLLGSTLHGLQLHTIWDLPLIQSLQVSPRKSVPHLGRAFTDVQEQRQVPCPEWEHQETDRLNFILDLWIPPSNKLIHAFAHSNWSSKMTTRLQPHTHESHEQYRIENPMWHPLLGLAMQSISTCPQVAGGTDFIQKTLQSFSVPSAGAIAMMDLHGYDGCPALSCVEEGEYALTQLTHVLARPKDCLKETVLLRSVFWLCIALFDYQGLHSNS